jgi:hypothetical protein
VNNYTNDPQKLTFVVMTGGCLPLEEGGSDFIKIPELDTASVAGEYPCQCDLSLKRM